MKRRTFIKGLAAAAASLFMPSRSRAHSAEKAIPDPVRTPAEEAFAERYCVYPDHPMSHLHDSLQYSAMMNPHSWTDADRGFLTGDQWPVSEVRRMAGHQRKLNHQRSLIINKLPNVTRQLSQTRYKK